LPKKSSDTVRALFDVNVLVATFDEEHVHHERAQQWWAANREHGWASCPLTQNGLVRVLSQPNYSNPISIAAALDLLAEQVAATDHAFWPDDISFIDARCFNQASILGPKQLTDIYLLALAVKNGGRLATLDRVIPLAAVRGAEARHVAVI
jgi:toxin-antitoxin system PIN domain toxin